MKGSIANGFLKQGETVPFYTHLRKENEFRFTEASPCVGKCPPLGGMPVCRQGFRRNQKFFL